MIKTVRYIYLISLFVGIPFLGFSQKKSDTGKLVDSSLNRKSPVIDTSVSAIIHFLESYTETLNKANAILKRGFDTSMIAESLPENERVVNMIQRNVNNGQLYNLRILYTNRVVLIQLKKRQHEWQETLLRFSHQIDFISNEIVSIADEPLFKKLSNDTGFFSIYVNQMEAVSKKWKQAELKSKLVLNKITILENRSVKLSFQINDLIDEIDFRISNFHKHVFKAEEPYIFTIGPSEYRNNFFKVYSNTFKRISFLLPFYISITAKEMLWHLIWIIVTFLWFSWCIKRLKKRKKPALFAPLQYINQGVLYMVLFFIFLVAPFVYDTPPLSLVQLLSLLMLAIYTKYVWNTWPEIFRKLWIYFLVGFIGVSLDVILLESAFFQRWLLLGLNIGALVLGYHIMKEVKKEKAKFPSYVNGLMNLYVLLNVLAIVMNFTGRVALAKLFSNSAILSVAYALSLSVLENLVFEIIYLNMEAFKDSKISKMFVFAEIKKNLTKYVQFLATAFWFMIFCFTLNLYDVIAETISNWLSNEIKIGNLSFSLSSVLLFIFILWVSNSISKLLMFFFGTSGQFASNKKSNNGSWVLLLRLATYTLGLFVAIGAAGIPMDKVTIVLGALGVGIGFGLQNIVSNLVSGIILAFEKPMQIGDVIEIEKQTGTVKEIGIRSSKITTYDGADIVVPNGEFISKQLINWTLTNSYRRIELIVGVSYQSELVKVQQLIMDIIQAHKEVQQYPKPAVFVHEFAESSINFRVLFWTADFDTWLSLKSVILLELFDCFQKNNITIPFPQRDLHIKTMNGITLEEITKNKEEKLNK